MAKSLNERFPNTNKGLSIKGAPKTSVGFPAIIGSIQQMGKYMDMPDALKASLKMNQKSGFDCAGCAWPDPDDERSALGEYCENGIKALVEEATSTKAGPDFFAKHSIDELAAMTEFELGKAGRITHPMLLEKGGTHYKETTWERSFQIIAEELNALNDPNEALFYTSGRTSNEAAFMYGLLARAYGTNNLPDCSNMCHETSGAALTEVLGIGKGSVTLEDIHNADLIMVIGQNPGTNHPRMLTALENCKLNGGKIISVNPLKEVGLIKYTNPQKPLRLLFGGVDLTDLYLHVRINGDMALLKAIIYLLLQREDADGGIFDHEFIKEYSVGYHEFINDIRKIDFQQCIVDSGISELEIVKAVDLICAGKNMIICWAMGITQHANGVETIREIVNLLLLRGSIGKAGAGVCPVRGHSNVQGDRTMGIWEKMGEPFLSNLEKAFDTKIPREEGYATVPAIKAMHEGKAKVFIGMGGNFVSAAPDTDYCAGGLRQCNLTAHVSTKPNRSHIVHGKRALILPVLGRSEIDMQESGYQFVSTENSMGIVQNSKGVLAPKSDRQISEVAVVCGIGDALFKESTNVNIDWGSYENNYDNVRDKIEEVIPGFENYNDRVRQKSGFYLPNGVKERKFKTKAGKAIFTVNELPVNHLADGEFQLGTVRAHDQYNTTLYGLNDRYRGVKNGRNIIFMNQDDMKSMSLKSKDVVNVHSEFKGERRSIYNFQIVPYDIPSRNLMAYFPEANPLVPIDHVHAITHTPVSKNIIVTLEIIEN
jgi:molybdopterin-dependent oxidoreductase alpha subunit